MDSKELVKTFRVLLGMDKPEEKVEEVVVETPEVVETPVETPAEEVKEVKEELAEVPVEEVPAEGAPEVDEETQIQDLQKKYDELVVIVQEIINQMNMQKETLSKVSELPADVPVHLKKSTTKASEKEYADSRQKLIDAFKKI